VRDALPHRAQTHRGVRLHAIAALPMRIWLWLTTAIVTKEWVACHRKHHAFADREGDPHSPLVEGLREILLKGAFYYRKAVRQPGMLEKYGKGTPNDWIERHLLTPLNWTGILVMLAIDIYLFGFFVGPGRVGRPDDLDPAVGRRRHQRNRPRARLSQLRGEGREPEHLADRHLARR
jgi:fatty-acid desaturase